jgi:mevalonate kinase
MAQLVEAAQHALLQGSDAALGPLMDENHRLLGELGVSTPSLDRACESARESGALGAKLTGSGGGGCVVALCSSNTEPVLDAWRSQGISCFSTVVASKSQSTHDL